MAKRLRSTEATSRIERTRPTLPPRPFAARDAQMPMIGKIKQRVRELKTETLALYLAARHPLTPWYAKLLVAAIVAYAISPVDLIPDFVPILGYLDDLVLIPIGIALAIKLIPLPVMVECRRRAQEIPANEKPVSAVAASIIVCIWMALAIVGIVWAHKAFSSAPALSLITQIQRLNV